MVTFLVTSIFILGLLAIAIYFWQKPAKTPDPIELPPLIPPRALFSDQIEQLPAPLTSPENDNNSELLSRAEAGDLKALEEAKNLDLYDKVLNVCVSQASSEAKLLSLASHVKRHELPVNSALAEAMLQACQAKPNKHSTAKALHFAALARLSKRHCVFAGMENYKIFLRPNFSQ
jgi:hypothetical protein